MSFADDTRHALPPPHPAARPFFLVGLILIVIGLLVAHWLSWVGLLFTLLCAIFFRDPERVPPKRLGVILAPADGRVASIAFETMPTELGLGAVTRGAYRHGSFLNASLDKASDTNERNAVALRLPDGREIAVVQIAGLIARRILCTVREGDSVHAGARFGIIRFGSRTDLHLPDGVRPLVIEGQTMLGGETVIAELES